MYHKNICVNRILMKYYFSMSVQMLLLICLRKDSFEWRHDVYGTFLFQLISSTFVPKAVIVVIMALLLRGILHFSESSLTVTALKQAGLYHSSVSCRVFILWTIPLLSE